MLIAADGRLSTNGRPAWIQHSRHSTVVTVSGSCLLRRVGSPRATEHRQHLQSRAAFGHPDTPYIAASGRPVIKRMRGGYSCGRYDTRCRRRR